MEKRKKRSEVWSFLILNVLLVIGCSSKQTETKVTPMDNQTLFEAVDTGNFKGVIALLKQKPALEQKNNQGQTPLMKALYNHHNGVSVLLIQAGANVNAQDKMLNSPFLYAGAEGNLEIVKLALDHGARFDIYNRYGGTALIPAAERGHLEVVKLLVNTPNFPKDHINNLQWTALLEAVLLGDGGSGQVAVVQALLAGGCNVNIADKDGITPLGHARKLGYKEMIKVLEQAGGK